MRSLFGRLHRRFGPRLTVADQRRRVQTRLKAFGDAMPEVAHRPSPRGESKRRRVVVVGGGLAGLMAARTLAGSHEVTVLEAREEVGGRVRSIVDPGSKRVIEAGAELIGYAHPTWLTLARDLGLGLSVWTTESDFDALRLEMPLDLCGHRLSETEANHVYIDMNVALEKMAHAAQKIKNPLHPWRAEGAADLDAMPLSDWIAKHGGTERTRAALEVEFANTNAAPTSRQSYLANLTLFAGAAQYGAVDDFLDKSENLRCAQGNQELARALAREITKGGGRVRCNCPAARVSVQASKVAVKTAAGHLIEADCAVLAIPPSLWPKSNPALVIEPAIPDDYYMTMGVAVKYLSLCTERFWIRNGEAPYGSSEALGMVWEGTDNQMQAPEQDVELTVFAGGNTAAQALAAFSRGGHSEIRAFYDEKIRALYPGYTPETRRPDARFIPWPMEPWTMAGYSCPAPGDVCRAGPKLLEPFNGTLYFAGEHTCLPFFGYMEGALQSGLHAARAILSR